MGCQMGVSTTGIHPLQRHLEQAQPPSRRVHGWFRPAEARQVVETLAVADARRRGRVLTSAARVSLVRQAQLAARDRTRGWDRVRKVAWQEISPLRMQVDAELTARGQRWLDSQLSEASLPTDWRKWASSKALAGGWVKLSSDAVRRWFGEFPQLRAASFRGGLAGLILGVDGGCPLGAEDPERWRYAWPTVLAAPLVRTPTTGLWWGERGGAPYALHLEDRGVWVGTGRGSGGAARRLWQGVTSQAPEPVAADAIAAFRIDLGAMRSAVQAAALGRTQEGQVMVLLDRMESLLPGVEIATVEVVRPSPRRLRAHLEFYP